MPTTDQDARALTYLAKRLREETHGACRWDEAGIWAVVAKLEGRHLADTIERVTRHAADPDAKTPGAINRPFVPDAPKIANHPPKRDELCPHHPAYRATNCGGCAADRAVEDTAPPPRAWDAGDAKAGAALVRAALTRRTEENA